MIMLRDMPDSSDLKFVHIKDYEPISHEVLETLPKSLVLQRRIVPLAKAGGRLTAAVATSEGTVKPQGLQLIAHCPVDLVLAPLEEIIDFIEAHYADEAQSSSDVFTSEPTPVPSPSALPVSLVSLLNEAVINRASEILIEQSGQPGGQAGGKIRVRQRIRGILMTDLQCRLTEKDATDLFEAVVREGRVQTGDQNRWADWNFIHSRNGESFACGAVLSETNDFHLLTIRLTPAKEKQFSPGSWGMGPHQARVLENLLQRRQGVLLFCGTESDDFLANLRSCARELATPERHVISLESVKKEWFPGIEQLVSNGDSALFSRLLKVAFRHEPDVVVIHSLEKKEDIEICLQEALKKPLVLCHSYARDAAEALIQILAMNIEPYLVGASLLGIIAQRNLRLNCPKCQEKDPIHRERVKEMGIPIAMQPAAFYRGKGCDACAKTGYDRETSLFEIMEMSDEVRNRLSRELKTEEVRSILKASGMMTLRQGAVHKAINGQTSLSEVLRATP